MENQSFDRFEKRVLIQGQVQLMSGLHIGSSEDSGMSGSDLPVIKDFLGRPFIPGSSFKGALRSGIESFLRALPVHSDQNVYCDVIKDELRCIGKNLKKNIIEQKGEFTGKDPDLTLWDKSCWVCRLFGSPWLASRVRVCDMSVDEASFLSEWMMIRDGVVIDRETGTSVTGGKYDFEVIPAQTRFDMEIVVENPDDYQMGLLVLGFDFFNQGMSMLGGKSARGLGRIKIIISEIQEQTVESILNALAESALAESIGEETDTGKEISELYKEQVYSPENNNSPADVVQGLLTDGSIKSRDMLIDLLKEKGWAKEKLRELNIENWNALFLEMINAGQIVEIEIDHYQAADKVAKKQEQPLDQTTDSEKAGEIERILQKWRNALWNKIQDSVVKEEV